MEKAQRKESVYDPYSRQIVNLQRILQRGTRIAYGGEIPLSSKQRERREGELKTLQYLSKIIRHYGFNPFK